MSQKYFVQEKKPDAKRHYVIPFIKKKKSKNKGNEFMVIKIRNWLLGMVGGIYQKDAQEKFLELDDGNILSLELSGGHTSV